MDGFTALADPTRRKIVELLADGPRGAGSLADEFAVSRPAISRHLRVLRETGVVSVRSQAQRRIYEIDPTGLDEIAAWVHRYRTYWSDRLDQLERAAKETE
jgi:DNA-binding transcriptional ArsR family regulator